MSCTDALVKKAKKGCHPSPHRLNLPRSLMIGTSIANVIGPFGRNESLGMFPMAATEFPVFSIKITLKVR